MNPYIFHMEPTPIIDRAFDTQDLYLESLSEKIKLYGGSYDLY